MLGDVMAETKDETRSARKHKAIMEAATTVFLSKGYLGATVDEIAALAAVSKQTVYKHFVDKEQLFAAIILATTDDVDEFVRLIASTLADSADLEKDLGGLARRLIAALMEPHLLSLRRLVIANADRLPHLGRAWYERGFERVLTTLADCFQRLGDELPRLGDPVLAAHHFVGLLLWIPVNKAMFTGDSRSSTPAELEHYADAAVATFLAAYGRVGGR
jgi:TetR/AcrR family transcriptional regulator, mexJK operon transcriptional repressor